MTPRLDQGLDDAVALGVTQRHLAAAPVVLEWRHEFKDAGQAVPRPAE